MMKTLFLLMLSMLATLVLPISTTAAELQNSAGQHDMLLLLPDGVVHLRAYVTDGDKSLQETRSAYLSELVATLDTDGDGKLARTETTRHPLFVSGRRFDGNKFLNSLRSKRPLTDRQIAIAVDRSAGQLVTYRQNNALADQDLSVFQVLDTDESGLIERTEMRLAPANLAARDTDFDECITFDEFLSAPVQEMPGGFTVQPNQQPPTAIHSELLRDAREPILAARLVRRYDVDRNAHLTHDEIGWTESRVAVLDSDGDGQLSMQELKSMATAAPDVVMTIDLSQDSSDAMALVGEDSVGAVAARSDLIRFRRGELAVSVGYRHRDPMAEAKQNASATFNSIDVDANGYLDREEIAEHQRFARYLFDAMDRDEDDRVFAEELLTYVEEYTRPASTTCQVTLLDTGNGMFQLLDANGDGRISIRELRGTEAALLASATDAGRINPSRLKKAYRVEIQRGGLGLFGRVDRPSAEAPATLLKPRTGPIWFQRMDRNGDGDLTWDEFLGPRDVFHKIDADQDDLISETEAKEASTRLRDVP